jgi:hypothetical protein
MVISLGEKLPGIRNVGLDEQAEFVRRSLPTPLTSI